jgi:hypothetical protein
MGVWNKLEFAGKSTGLVEIGSKKKNPNSKGKIKTWSFFRNKRFGRKFYAALDRIKHPKLKPIILDLVREREERGRLTQKQWKYLELLMNRTDPACRLKFSRFEKDPVIWENKKKAKKKKSSLEKNNMSFIVRKKDGTRKKIG